MRFSALTLSVVGLLITRAAIALPPSHSPFEPKEDRLLRLPACESVRNVTGDANSWEGSVEFSLGMTRLSLHVQTYGIDELQVFEGSTLAAAPLPVALDIATYGDVREQATCADLNRDGRVDF